MRKLSALLAALAGALLLPPSSALAHCDSVSGPVATAAVQALDARNVNVILPYAPAEAEAELVAAYEQALAVRRKGPDARALADRYFMETAVRLHRAGEHAPYTGLKPAGTDFGPAIPAAERALETGKVDGVRALLAEEVHHGVTHRFEEATARAAATKAPTSHAGVQAARERVSAELGFVGYAEGIYAATKGAGHAE